MSMPDYLAYEDAATPAGTLLMWGMLLVWVMAEGAFYVWYINRVAHKSATPAVIPDVSAEHRDFVFENIQSIAEHDEEGVWRLLKGWFYPSVAPHELGQDNLNELLGWAFCYKDVEDLTADEWAWVERAKDEISRKYGFTPQEGRTEVEVCRQTIDPVVSSHHPLFFYFGVALLKVMGSAILRARGYQPHRNGPVTYWHRAPNSSDGEEVLLSEADNSSEALIFFHGIGMGVVLYFTMILGFAHETQFLFEMPWISMNPWAKVVSDKAYAEAVQAALGDRGITGGRRLCLAGHSFGSLPIVWLKRHCGEVYDRSRVVLMDPVCVYLNLPDVCVNFLYRTPHLAFEKMLRYLASQELGISCSLYREFFWMQSVLFPGELPEGSCVVLSECDHVVPVHEIYKGCQRAGVKTMVLDGVDHGMFLFMPNYLRRVLDVVNSE